MNDALLRHLVEQGARFLEHARGVLLRLRFQGLFSHRLQRRAVMAIFRRAFLGLTDSFECGLMVCHDEPLYDILISNGS